MFFLRVSYSFQISGRNNLVGTYFGGCLISRFPQLTETREIKDLRIKITAKFDLLSYNQITEKNDQHAIIKSYTGYVSTNTQIINWSNWFYFVSSVVK